MLCTGCVSPSAEEAALLVQKLPVIDACDSDVATHCLADKGLNTYRVGEIRQCLVGMITPLSPPDSTEKVGLRGPACASLFQICISCNAQRIAATTPIIAPCV